MIRVTAETHRRFAALHARREAGRERGQVKSAKDRVTQDDVLVFLLNHEEGTQRRRRRSRNRRTTRQTTETTGAHQDEAVYTRPLEGDEAERTEKCDD